MAAPGGLTLPVLRGVPQRFVRETAKPLAAALAARLIEVGLADPAGWPASERDPQTFLQATVARWSSEAGGDAVGEDFIGVAAGLLSDIRPFFWEAAEDPRLDRMWVVFEHDHSHEIVEMQHVVSLLEPVHPRLPAAFDHLLVSSLNSVGYVWNAWEAREWFEMYGDWVIEQVAESRAHAERTGEEHEDPWPIEVIEPKEKGGWPTFATKDMRLPALRRKPLAESSVRRLLPKLTPRVRRIMEIVLEMNRLVNLTRADDAPIQLFERLHYQAEEVEHLEIHFQHPPVLVMPMERYDAIERTWDEQNHALMNMGEPVHPLLAYHFDATKDEEIRWAHQVFQKTTRVFALAAELMPLLPTRDPSALSEALVELEVDA